MVTLVTGQNTELDARDLIFSVAPSRVPVAALLLDGQRRALPGGYVDPTVQPTYPGVTASAGCISISLDAVATEVAQVLCLALDPQPGTTTLTFTLDGEEVRQTNFTIPAAETYPAVIGFELYKRAGRWKVRAIRQGYAGGVADLARVFGIPPTLTALPITPLGEEDSLQRISMIYEDAARSTAALLAARSFADQRRDSEMTAAVGDPATRNTAVGQQAITEAQRRHDELLAGANADYRRDSAHLIAELNVLDGQLPSALASWSAPAWRRRPAPACGIRLGVVTLPDAGPLAVPLCLPVPMRRPVWIDTSEPSAATPVLASVLTRLLAAAPQPCGGIDVIDLADALGSLTGYVQAYMPRPTFTAHADVTARLQYLARRAEMTALHECSDAGSIVVITDPGHGFPPEAIQATAQLIELSVPAGLSVLLVGDYSDASSSTGGVLREIAEYSHRFRGDSDDSEILDPWTYNAWRFVPDTLEPATRIVDLISTVTPPPAVEPPQ